MSARALEEFYATPPSERIWRDPSDAGFIGIHLIERGLAALALRLESPLLDVGCGRQPYRPCFAHLEKIVACDFNAARGEVDFACPADRIPVEAGSFGSILCTEVLEHVPDPAAVWREFFRVLRPGGRVLLSTPMYWPAHEEPYDFYRYPSCGLQFLARGAGFTIEVLWPRGGSWAFLGQVAMHVCGHYLHAAWMRRAWNRAFLRLDRARRNPGLSLGWTLLAAKPR